MEVLNLQKEEKEIQELQFQIRSLKQEAKQIKEEKEEALRELDCYKRAQEILQNIAKVVQEQTHSKIIEIVSQCLSSVFGRDSYDFGILFKRKRGRTEAKLTFLKHDHLFDPMNSAGGGVVDVASFALRVSSLLLHRPPLSKVLILDEPFRFVSAQYQENVRQLLEEISKKLHIQIIMVTHNKELVTGKEVIL